MPKPGKIAFLSQSGALGSAILEWAIHENIGFSNFVSVGSMIDVDFGDLIDYFGSDPKTKSIIMYRGRNNRRPKIYERRKALCKNQTHNRC